jgi:hypothetical protein
MTPYELRALANFRRRGQAPTLAVFVMDDWAWAARLTDDIGVLTIRVRNARDHDHDWSAVAGLWVYLILRNPAPADVADFSAAILRANPVKLTVSAGGKPAIDVWEDAA